MHRFMLGHRTWLGVALIGVVLAVSGGCGGAEKVAQQAAATTAPPTTVATTTTTPPTTTAATTTAAPTTTTTRPRATTTSRRPTTTTRHVTTTTRHATATTSAPARNCDPAYPDACLHDGIGDYDCAGGSGNGPNYVDGPIQVRSPDPFGLDSDGDGVGCES